MSNIWLVAKREIVTRMRTRAYIISTIVIVIAIFAFAVFGGSASREQANNAMLPEFAKQQMVAQEQARQEVLAEYGIDAAELEAKIEVRYEELMAEYEAEHPDSQAESGYWVGYVAGILLFVAITITGSMIAQGVAEEKSSRIVELLLSSMTSFQLMAGKIIGIGIVGLTQLAVILGSAYFAITNFGAGLGAALEGINFGAGLILAFAFFLVGYFSYAALYASFASTVSRAEEVNIAITPVMYILMVPYIATLIPAFANIPLLGFLLDYCPLLSPIGATVHYFQGTLPLVNTLLSLGISIVALPGIFYIASRIYRRSVLSTGARLRITALLRSK